MAAHTAPRRTRNGFTLTVQRLPAQPAIAVKAVKIWMPVHIVPNRIHRSSIPSIRSLRVPDATAAPAAMSVPAHIVLRRTPASL